MNTVEVTDEWKEEVGYSASIGDSHNMPSPNIKSMDMGVGSAAQLS